MQIRRTLGERGQVVIPKDIRDYLNLKPGSEVIFEIKEGEVVIKARRDLEKFVKEFINAPKKVSKISIRKLKKILEEEYEVH
jgi:AbrB family transcriptional regulator (stage V sporulation protein T)